MPVIRPRWQELSRAPIGALKPSPAYEIENTGAAYQMPYAPLPMQVDSRVPMMRDNRTGSIIGGTAEPGVLQYFVSHRIERAGRVYSPRPVSLPGGSFNGDTLYIGSRNTGDVYGR